MHQLTIPANHLASYFCLWLFTILISIPLAGYFLVDHFIIHPSIRPSVLRVIFRPEHLILHPLASYFRAQPSNSPSVHPLASYFRAIHPLGELFSCRPSGRSRPGHKVSGTRSKSPNLNEMDKNPIFREVFLTQNPVNILSRSATVTI